MSTSAYRPIAPAEGQAPAPTVSPRAQRLQWVCLALLTGFAGFVLATKVQKVSAAASLGGAPFLDANASFAPHRRRRRDQPLLGLGIGRTGASSASFVLRSRRRSIKSQAAKAATRSVILVGSHFGLGNELLKRVFNDLCQRPRLALRCEAEWGGVHDLKSLASIKGRKKRRIVWLENNAGALRRTLRGLRTHAYNYRLVHLLWDPVEACVAQWPASLQTNMSFGTLCQQGLRMDGLPAFYKRAKRDRAHALQLRLEDLVGAKPPWRKLLKFLELPDKAADLSSIGSRAVSDLELRGRVHNSAAPGWVRDSLAGNASLMLSLREMRLALDYGLKGKGKATGLAAAATNPGRLLAAASNGDYRHESEGR